VIKELEVIYHKLLESLRKSRIRKSRKSKKREVTKEVAMSTIKVQGKEGGAQPSTSSSNPRDLHVRVPERTGQRIDYLRKVLGLNLTDTIRIMTNFTYWAVQRLQEGYAIAAIQKLADGEDRENFVFPELDEVRDSPAVQVEDRKG